MNTIDEVRPVVQRATHLVALVVLGFGLAVAIWPSAAAADADQKKPKVTAPPSGGHLEIPDDEPAHISAPLETGRTGPYQRGPYVSVQVNVNSMGHNIFGDAANEPSIAIDPTDPDRMVIGWRQFDYVSSNFRQAGWGYSNNGGRSWTFPGVIEPGVFRSDPVLDADTQGDFYYNSLTYASGDYICHVFRSTSGGLTWDDGTYAYGGDKQWMTIDRTDGIGQDNIYAYWTQYYSICNGNMTRSYDGGQTYLDCIEVPGNPYWGTMAVGPDGELYIAGDGFIVAKSSTLQDQTLPAAFDFITLVDLGGSMGFSGGPNPAGLLGQVWIAVDHSDGPTRGYVYLLCSVDPTGPDPLDVMFARSTDGGSTWSEPIRVNDDPTDNGAWQWFGTMSVAPDGRIDVVWNDTRNDPGGYLSELYYAYSYDAGQSWSVSRPVSPAFNPHLGWPQQNKLGDYCDMISDQAGARLAYAATFNEEQDVYFLALGDCNTNGIHDSEELAAGTGLDCNSNGVLDECDVASQTSGDCNRNGAPDECDIAAGESPDADTNGVPDECDTPVLFVDEHAAGAYRNGLTWETAYTDLQEALATASGSEVVREIWVAAGTYRPDQGTGDRRLAFNLINGVAVYGGFAGDETSLEQRDPTANATALSGDLNDDDETLGNADNSYHVVWADQVDATALLDGLVIRGGNADGLTPDSLGGGIYVDRGAPTFVNCVIGDNVAHLGGGMYDDYGDPTLMGCSFVGNSAVTSAAGGLYVLGGSPTLIDCAFVGNAADASGGGVYLIGADTTAALVNCLFSGNQAGDDGGGLSNFYVGPTYMTNCTFSANTAADNGGGFYAMGLNAPTLANCILWGNADAGGGDESAQLYGGGIGVIVNYTCIQGLTGGLGGAGNIGTDPSFADPDGDDDQYGTADDDLHLQEGSPCIDAGDNDAVSGDILTDLDGNPRFVDDPDTEDTGNGGPPVVDMGAYELQQETIVSAASLIDHGGTELALDLTTNNIEPRQAGVTKVEFTTSGPVSTVSADLNCNRPYGGSVTASPAGATVTVEFSEPLPDQDCCEVILTGDVADHFWVRTLAGDVDRNGTVTTGDASIIKPHFGEPATAAGAEFDYDCGGTVTTADFSVIAPMFGHAAASCP